MLLSYFAVDYVYCLNIFLSNTDSKNSDYLQEKVNLNKAVGTEFFSFFFFYAMLRYFGGKLRG